MVSLKVPARQNVKNLLALSESKDFTHSGAFIGGPDWFASRWVEAAARTYSRISIRFVVFLPWRSIDVFGYFHAEILYPAKP